MVVTIVVVIENVCMSMHWKSKHVVCRICIQTLAKFMLHVALNLRIHMYVQSAQISSALCPIFKNP
jgi:hypothetical protein